MLDWIAFALAFALFVVTHAVPSRPAVKGRIVAVMGRSGYGLAYGLVSLATLAALLTAANGAPVVPLAPLSRWQLLTPFVLMVPACLLVAFATARPNPYSFGGFRNERFDPSRPGIVRFTRHPFLLAIALWAVGHAVANPALAHLLLFGGFVGLCVTGMATIDRRHRRGAAPVFAAPERRVAGMGLLEIMLRVVAAAALYGALVGGHPWFAGVPVSHVAGSLIG